MTDEGDKGITFTRKHLDRHCDRVGDAAALGYACGMAAAVCSWVADKYGPEVAAEMAQDLVWIVASDFNIPAEGGHSKN